MTPQYFDPPMADLRRLIAQAERRIEVEENHSLVRLYEQWLSELRKELMRLECQRKSALQSGRAAA